MPETGENVAEDFAIGRADQDQFAIRSQARAAEAQANGRLAREIPAAVDHAPTLADDDRQAFTPMLAILSAQHETQYSRLFRS